MKAITRRRFAAVGGAAAVIAGLGLSGAGYYFRNIITRWWSGTFTKVNDADLEYSSDEAHAESEALSIEIEGEGAVLLKNDGLLPLSSAGNVALLGNASYDPVYMGAGSISQGDGSNEIIDFYTAFDNAGFSVDETMRTYYEEKNVTLDDTTDMFSMMGSDYNINDDPVSEYQTELDAAAASNDLAVVVFARTGGEGGDVPIEMGSYTNGDAGRHYLELQTTEQELLDYAVANFDQVVVILDSSNPMELGFLEDEGVDAALWIGAPGHSGITAVPQILLGDYNPSGHLVDIFPYDITSNPTYYTCTAGTYNNYEDFDQTDEGFDNEVDGGMIWYAEGIYEGYRYYETADAMGVIDYDSTVQFPFGFGLSYTTFDWEVGSTSLGSTGGEISVEVTVTNSGSVAGKDVVQLYYTAPYTEGGIEKSAKVLGAFAKTSLLDPGASETVTLTMGVDDLASYDHEGYGCYVADAGTYYLYLQTDSHNVKDGCDPIEYEVSDTRVYNDSGVGARATDAIVAENRFDNVTAGDGNIGTTIPWMTRADMAGTHPEVTMGAHITDLDVAMGDDCVAAILASNGGSDVSYDDDDAYETKSLIPVETGVDYGLTIDDVASYDEWDDEIWDQLVNEMTVDELATLVADCGYGTPAIDSIGKGLATDIDGPAGISSSNLNYYGQEFPGEPVTAATWNVELAAQMGAAVGNECNAAGINGWYAPGINIHRTPFGGRCAEYYSEDPLLSGKMAAAEIQAVQEKGVYVYAKHFAVNDQDNKRGGMYTWATEQALREIYLRGFEYAAKEGEAQGFMCSYNRIGTMMSSVCKALVTGVLQEEWGTHPLVLTDGYATMIGCDLYENPDLQIRAGGGMLLNIMGYDGTNGFSEKTTGSDKGIEMLHDMAKRILYVYANSNAVTIERDYTPYWAYLLGGVDVLLAGAAVAAGVYCHRSKKAELAAAAEAEAAEPEEAAVE